MKSIKMEFVRDGEPEGALVKDQRYHVMIESARHRQFNMPLAHRRLLELLAQLRYNAAIPEAQRAQALQELSRVVTEILEAPADDAEPTQLDLVTDARELWALPFEAAVAPTGMPLFAQPDRVTVLTRRAPQPFAERRPDWPSRPRILFAHASPAWINAPAVPASAHKDALLKALQPWVEPIPDLPILVGREESVLTTLQEASLADIASACQKAMAEKRPYTHVHLLAHGIPIRDPVFTFKERYGVALQSDRQAPTTPEELVAALRPRGVNSEQDLPVAVTLAICDGGNATNTIISEAGIAQELHIAGVPIVVASQLPLTFPGSAIITGTFYTAWLAGTDVRAALHAVRVALYQAVPATGHDWLSLVGYVRFPEGYSDYLLDVRLQSELAALETGSKHAQYLLEHNIADAGQYDQVAARLHSVAQQLDAFLHDPAVTGQKSKLAIVQENAGLLGSAYKRLAELLARRTATDAAQREHWLEESRVYLDKARAEYRTAFEHNTANHWGGVQWLAIEAVLCGRIDTVAHWYACYVAAEAKRRDKDPAEQLWALGSIAELGLLAPLCLSQATGADAADAVTSLCKLEASQPASAFVNLSPRFSTRRQLLRYVNWWTKANGFFPERATDLAQEAQKLVNLLNEGT